MQQIFTRGFMRQNCGCYSQADLDACSFMQAEPITLKAIVYSKIPLRDKYWFICRKLATKRENQEISIRMGEILLPLWEEKYPDDKRPHEAILAARQYMASDIILEELMMKKNAAENACFTADLSHVAYANIATNVAWVAYHDSVAYEIAYSTAAYATAVVNGNVSDLGGDIKKQLEDYLLTFIV